jgi:inner membrane protein
MQTETISFWERNRMLIKGFLIGFLILIMLIPTAFLLHLVSERQGRQNEVINEVSSKWGNQQTITGPLIVVPYLNRSENKRKTAYFLPETLNVNGDMRPEVRHRSLYDVELYRSEMTLSGKFAPITADLVQLSPDNVYWNEARLVMGLGDARGLEDEVMLTLNGRKQNMSAGAGDNDFQGESVSSLVTEDLKSGLEYNIHIKAKGSSYLYFVPVGKTTEVALHSNWKDPAFDGQYLPSKTPVITKDGFDAYWKVLQVSRSFPQAWKDGSYELAKSAFGVKLLQPTDGYAMTERCVKYAILFIALTFIVFFFMEIMQKVQVHPLQYILVGMALCVFYTLLLSISEYAGFNPAYLIASSATVLLIGIYVWGIFRKFKVALAFTIALAALYGYIFTLVQLQDYALIFGSIGLFVILAIIMFYSNKIDWYSASKHKEYPTA